MEKTCTGCVVSAGTHKPAEALHQIDEPQADALRLADECEESATHLVNEIDTRAKAAKMLRAQHARIAELEAQLEAIGAGGVEPLRKQAAPQAVQKCEGCNGHGLVGGLLPGDGGYESEECPFCKGYGDATPAHQADGVPAQPGNPLRDLALGVTSFLDHAGFDTSHLPAGMGAALRRLRDAAIATHPAAQGMDAS